MPKTLAQLRAAPPAARPERAITVCLAPDKVAELQNLTAELAAVPAISRRAGAAEHPRAGELRAQIEALLAEMTDDEGELRVRAGDDGEWRRWTNDHPARPAPEAATDDTAGSDGQPGWARDLEVARGYCNADDLIDDLGTYVCSWNGEPLAEGDWDILRASIAPPDLKEIAQAVVAMHESRLDFRQWRSRWSAVLRSFDDSEQPETSASARAASTGGSRPARNAGTTKRAAK